LTLSQDPNLAVQLFCSESETNNLIISSLLAKSLPEVAESSLLSRVTSSLGNNARNIELFVDKVEEQRGNTNMRELLSNVFDDIVNSIHTYYNTKTWQDVVGGHAAGVMRMCVWTLAGKQVRLDDKLNGVTVEDVRSTGIVQVKEADLVNDLFTLQLPLIVIAAINMTYKFVSRDLFNPVKESSWAEFGTAMAFVRILRNNMLVNLGQKTATLRELYPHAIGRSSTLDRVVSFYF
jgi:hypothetical protein